MNYDAKKDKKGILIVHIVMTLRSEYTMATNLRPTHLAVDNEMFNDINVYCKRHCNPDLIDDIGRVTKFLGLEVTRGKQPSVFRMTRS